MGRASDTATGTLSAETVRARCVGAFLGCEVSVAGSALGRAGRARLVPAPGKCGAGTVGQSR
jgi:hypothetical protein